MKLDDMQKKLQGELSPKRFAHSVGVMETAALIAGRHGQDVDKAAIAGLIHDCAREWKGPALLEGAMRYGIPVDALTQVQPVLLHGAIGARLAIEDYEVHDSDILNAITYHTTGRADMSQLEKIIFLADYIEPSRNFPGVEAVRNETMLDLDRAMQMALDKTLHHVMKKGMLMHLDTVKARNDILARVGSLPADWLKNHL